MGIGEDVTFGGADGSTLDYFEFSNLGVTALRGCNNIYNILAFLLDYNFLKLLLKVSLVPFGYYSQELSGRSWGGRPELLSVELGRVLLRLAPCASGLYVMTV